jgi:uncharacterized protein (TIGR02594 family)
VCFPLRHSTPPHTTFFLKYMKFPKLPNSPILAAEDNGSTPYEVARNYLGTREIPGKQHSPVILRWLRRIGAAVFDDETAWCSTFVNYCALVTGRERSGSLAARSWLKIGEAVPMIQARKGDVVILWRVRRDSWQGHVAFLERYDAHAGVLHLLGGNQNNAVNISAYPVSQCLGVRRLRRGNYSGHRNRGIFQEC